MKRKPKKQTSRSMSKDEEQVHLLSETDTSDNSSPYREKKNNERQKRYLQRLDSKVDMSAPEANDTSFEDVPVMIICPHCRMKVVTKTSYSKKKPCCFCCCSQEILMMFKPVRHNCPKCNQRIAKYNRFGFNFRSHYKVYEEKSKVNQPIVEEEKMQNNNNNDFSVTTPQEKQLSDKEMLSPVDSPSIKKPTAVNKPQNKTKKFKISPKSRSKSTSST
ncbi:uncharacterized protein [Clytia hemisphaerica]